MTLRQKILIALGLSILFILFAAISGVVYGLLALIVGLLIGPDVLEPWIVLAVLYLAWSFVPERWKALQRPYEVRGEVMIDAPAARVWDLVLPRPGKPFMAETFTDVTTVPGSPKRLDLHVDPKHNGLELPPLQVVLDEVAPMEYLRMRFLNIESYPMWAGDLETSETYLERVDGQVRLTQVETLKRLRLSTVLSLFLLNPCRDSVRRTKALCEGVPDPSWMTWIGQQSQAPADGRPGLSGIASVGLLMCVFVTLLVFGLLYLLFLAI